MQKEYLGGVSATNLAADMTNVATTFSVTAGGGSTFPTGATLPFVVVIGRGTSSEEKILCASRSGDTFTVTTRGYDGTSAVAHTGGPAVEHCIDALVVTEASKTAAQTISKVTTAGDLLYGTGAEALTRLGIGTARQVLATNSAATAPEWVASIQSLLTASGDLLYASAANTPARLPKGTAAQVLTMNSGATAPEWAAAGGGGAVALIAGSVLGASASSITFSAIPATYRHLRLVLNGRGVGSAVNSVSLFLRLNGDVGATYDWRSNYASGASVVTSTGAADTEMEIGYLVGASAPAGEAASVVIDLPSYARTTFRKSVVSLWGGRYSTAAGDTIHGTSFGSWANTAAVTSLSLLLAFGSFDVGTVATLYGFEDV